MTTALLANQQQFQFLQSKKPRLGYIGGIGSGKTHILVTKSVLNALSGRIQGLVSFTYTNLKDVILPTFENVANQLGLDYRYHYTINKSDMTIAVLGTLIYLRSSDKMDRLRGLNLHDAGIDEACYHKNPRDLINLLIGRLRLGSNNQLMIGTTPKGFDEVYEYFMTEEDENKLLLRSSTRANSFLTKEYIDALDREYTGAYKQQELEGEFVDFSGGVINGTGIRIVDKAPEDVELVRFYDLAITERQHSDFTASCLGGFSKSDNKFYICDITNRKKRIDDTMEEIIARSQIEQNDIGIEKAGQMEGYIIQISNDKRMRQVRVVPIAPQGSKVVRAMLWASKIETGAICMVKADWNRALIQQCNSFTQDDTHKHDDMVDAVSGCYQMTGKPKNKISGGVISLNNLTR